MNTQIIILFLSISLLFSCEPKKTKTNGEENVETLGVDPENSHSHSDSMAHSSPNSNSGIQPNGTSPSTNQGLTGDANPAHGLPGHRCDIPVGSPLSGVKSNPPQGSLNPVVSPPTTIVAPTPVSSDVKTAPGMNPPHGQPGHDCSIPVGSPLKK